MFAEAAGLAVLAAISLAALVWLPTILYLAAPEPTPRRQAAFNGWLRQPSTAGCAAMDHPSFPGAQVAAGAILTVNGITGLIQEG